MSKGLEVFAVDSQFVRFELEEAKKVINGKLDPSWVKKKKQGKTELSYIGGHTVIRLLNKAFNYQWSFEVVSEEIKESYPKPVYDGWGQQRKPALNPDGSPKMEAQPPVAKVLGRLTVPGVGVREQYGSQVLVGGATEQESGFKAASTDALKKCASLFGIGLELYGEDEGLGYEEEVAPQPHLQVVPNPVVAPAQAAPQAPPVQPAPPTQPAQATPEQAALQAVESAPAPAQAPPQQAQTANAGGYGQWQQEDITRLKELKMILGIMDNQQLNPFVREFFDNPNVTYDHITPENIKAVNIFLTKKAEAI